MSDSTEISPEMFFSRLKPYGVHLLDLAQNPTKNPSFLRTLAALLRETPPRSLQPFLDFTLFPLLLLLDASVQSRASRGSAPMVGHRVNDAAAEGVLDCLEELLAKCYLGSIDQMVAVLKKLAAGAMLSPAEASEELRIGIVRCLRAMLMRLRPCSNPSCTCKNVLKLSSVVVNHEQWIDVYEYSTESKDCLIAFLQSQDASAAVGHWLSLLLQIAEVEADRGQRGSSNLRKEAFLTLRMFIAKIGSADALAFFLPGVVSRFAKALHATKQMISGAAGSSGSIEQAILGLTDFLIVVLDDKENLTSLEMLEINIVQSGPKENKSTHSTLEALRNLPISTQYQRNASAETCADRRTAGDSAKGEINNYVSNAGRSLSVNRSKEWIQNTSSHVDKLLSATFPHLCVHPAEKVRQALVEGIKGLLSHCSYTLKKSKLMLLESLCILVCDESESVSLDAQEALESLFVSCEKFLLEHEVSEMFSRLIEALPRAVLGSEEVVAVSHARRLLALMYYAGPKLVIDHLLSSPVKVAHFLDLLGRCLSQNAQFTGPLNNLIKSKPLSLGYLLSVAELKSGSLLGDRTRNAVVAEAPVAYKISELHTDNFGRSILSDFAFPHMPPWFVNIGSEKLYQALAGILRLIGLSLLADHRNEISVSVVIDVPLDSIRKLISELRMKAYNKESWQSWYSRSGSGQQIRQTSSAVCIINEIVYGLSDRWICSLSKLFGKPDKKKVLSGEVTSSRNVNNGLATCHHSVWKIQDAKDAMDQIALCVGSIMHEYMSSEIWDLPLDQSSPFIEQTEGNLPLYFFRETMMLHQVIIEGIGIFSITLGKDFISCGFTKSCIYLLLQNLICSNNQIQYVSDAALQVLSTSCNFNSVGDLVVANADYIIDSLCRQLRHLDVYPHVPDVLAAVLSYIGAAYEILPLLEEPMRAVSLELEVLGRHQHPSLTVPFLKAIQEISKVLKHEGCSLADKAGTFHEYMKSNVKLQHLGNGKHFKTKECPETLGESGGIAAASSSVGFQLESCKEFLFKLNETRRYRRIVGSLAESCLKTATPLLASMNETTCLVALDIVEDSTIAVAKVEEAYKQEKESKEEIERMINSLLADDPQDMDAAVEDADENRLLPAMNKIWPYLILCFKNKISVAVIRRCASVLSSSVQISRGDFFIRRFRTDGPTVWKLLTSPFSKKLVPSKDEKPLLLPYRNTSLSSENPVAEVSDIKIQAAILNMIAEISSNKRSASAFQLVLKKLSGLVVGIACSNITGLQDASFKAVSGLACLDSDLLWLLVADVYYWMKNKNHPHPPDADLPEIPQVLPPPSSSKDYLYVQYGGETFGVVVEPSSVDRLFEMLDTVNC